MKDSFIYSISHFFISRICKLFFRMKVVGLENVPCKGAVLLASNHASYLDPLFIGSAVSNRQIFYIARDTLFRNRYFAWLITKWHTLPIKRGVADKRAFERIFELLQGGAAILLFPEGTRSADGQLQPAKRGIGVLALQANVPIIPVYVSGSYKALPKGSKMVKLSPVSVYFGKAITVDRFSSLLQNKEASELLSTEIMNNIAELKQSVEIK